MIVRAECEFHVPDSHSLKEKRSVLKRVLTRVKQRYNISAAEIDHQDTWQRSLIELVSAAADYTAAEKEVQRAISYLESFPEWEPVSCYVERL
ncbi:DUF503 domain-containing protein [Jeotgalibacillus sp. R-1-5s-1]|uniref:DUF503 domain-containing protein n=1 Tax=Jeotgalibacillus sp. R-1-5s-1 TaxID=2555897 RepID=UPI0010695F87|nr:DUF503 domain-containing protein [Jeotgalibacillus sp. R-1-5s-1]TFE03457.1 DUF503 domain-containing protein [Jeotgalibacillus sp. R-1-5s-1]